MKIKFIISQFLTATFIIGLTACQRQTVVSRFTDPAQDTLTVVDKVKKDKEVIVEDDYYLEYRIHYSDLEYRDYIQTVLLYSEGFEISAPIIEYGSGHKLVLKFDDLNGDTRDYKYTLIHCDASWKPSDMMPQEYLDGFTEDFITDIKYSFNTLQKYTHYTLTFPTENIRPTKSGNYVLVVFPENNPDSAVLTRRFMITENYLIINAVVNRATAIEYKNYKQEIDFTIDKSDFQMDDPFREMKVVIQQNSRWDNAVFDIKPLYVKGDLLDYNYEEENVFTGGNEFHWFDIKSLKWKPETTRKVIRDSVGNFHVYLQDDERATFKNYYSLKDINGRKLIKSEDNANDSDIESEYVYVHFFLNYAAPFTDGSIYVLGAITNWQFSDMGKMKYNYSGKGYEAVLYLKQGYYNFQYVFLENNSSEGDETVVEGMHYETENDYTIYVYYRQSGTVYDRLIAIKQFNTYTKN